MFTNLNTDPKKKPRLHGELGDLAHAKLSSGEFKYSNGTEIFGEAEPADYIYQVIEGAVRSHKLLSDGRRQIGAFHLPGDIFGLENGDFHRLTAEAIIETTVCLIKRQSLERIAKTDPAMVRSLLTMTTDSLQHVENQLLLLGRKTSLERVAAFSLRWIVAWRQQVSCPFQWSAVILRTISALPSRRYHARFLNFSGRVT